MKNIFHLTELREKGEWLGWAGPAGWRQHQNIVTQTWNILPGPVVSVAPGPTFRTMSPVIFIVAILMYLHSPGSSTLAQGYDSSVSSAVCVSLQQHSNS